MCQPWASHNVAYAAAREETPQSGCGRAGTCSSFTLRAAFVQTGPVAMPRCQPVPRITQHLPAYVASLPCHNVGPKQPPGAQLASPMLVIRGLFSEQVPLPDHSSWRGCSVAAAASWQAGWCSSPQSRAAAHSSGGGGVGHRRQRQLHGSLWMRDGGAESELLEFAAGRVHWSAVPPG
jgi:hypothetical protein